MASVVLKAGSKNYFACFKIPTGDVRPNGRLAFRRVQRSTGMDDESRALQLAISYERAAKDAAQKRWTERSAHRLITELDTLTGIQSGQNEVTAIYFSRWLEARKLSIDPSTAKSYATRVRDFMKFLGHRENGPLSDITPTVIAGFRDAERAAGKSKGTVNLSLTIISGALGEAFRMGLLASNPVAGLALKGAKKSAQKRRAFTFEQFRALVEACEPEWKTFVMLCGYTGARQQEAASIEWSQIDAKGKRLTLTRTKTGDEHWMPMHESLVAHFRKMKHGAGPVMPRLASLDGRNLSTEFREKILPRIGIAQEYRKAEGKGRQLAEYSIHSLRHSLATWLNDAGVSELMRMRIVGHEDEAISRGYTHTEFAQLQTELAKVRSV